MRRASRLGTKARYAFLPFVTFCLFLIPCIAMGQESTPITTAIAVPAVINAGDTAWMLVATALVLFMNIPGLALFYAGLVRKKNVLSVMMHCFVLTAAMSILWTLFGYSMAFDSTGMSAGQVNMNSIVGGFGKSLLSGVDANAVSGTIPEPLFALFQMTFAVITPALMIGAFAERIKFSAMLWFSVVWFVLVYIPICHMTWAGPGGLFFDWGVIDLAGGIVVHITAGFSALVACILVGPRKGFPDRMDPPHNLTLTIMGTAMLWVGWFGFNGGSVLAANGQAAMTVLVTHLSACAATLVWMAIEWLKLGKPSVLGASTGSIAGLAAITPASGVVGPLGAIVIGALSGGLCFVFATMIKRRFRYDDTLDVFGVHGVGGFLGTIMAGVFAAGFLGGNKGNLNIVQQTMIQAIAAMGTAVYSMAVSWIILVAIKKSIGLRVEGVSEDQGLDLSEHEERGYNFL